jgi:CBS-domain-containing membrane protein
MRNHLVGIVQSWGTRPRFNLAGYLWIAGMFGILAALEANRLGLFLVPPFGATLSILLLLPDASIAQPYALITGSVVGAAVGTCVAHFDQGLGAAVVALVIAFGVLSLIRAYHPPGVALSIYPILLHPGSWFALEVVLPFAVAAVGSAALLSRLVASWPAYPKPLGSRPLP